MAIEMGYFILNWQFDLLAFAVLSVCLTLGLQFWVWRRHAVARGVRFRVWGIILLIIAMGCAGAGIVGRQEAGRLKMMICGFAATYAQEMIRIGHERFDENTPADDPKYLEAIEAERRWLAVNPVAADIYTFIRLEDGRTALMVDAETDYDRDGLIEGPREARTAIGEPYDEDAELIAKAFAGEAVFTPQPTTDRWGTWISTYTPMFDAHQRVAGVLGVDYPAENWIIQILMHRAVALLTAEILIGVVLTAAGITAYTAAEGRRVAELHRRAATHDSLTGLPNRVLFYDRLNQAVQLKRRRPDQQLAVLFIDFDRFKTINDTLGHEVGDHLLKAIAARLAATLRDTDSVCRPSSSSNTSEAAPGCGSTGEGSLAARLGGDEFCVLLQGLRQADDATIVANRICHQLAEPFEVAGTRVESSASIGVAMGLAAVTPEQLIRDADAAMYQAKAQGKARVVVHSVTLAA